MIDWTFFKQDWIWGALGLAWALGYGLFEVIKQQRLLVKQEKDQLEEQIRQNDIRMKTELREAKIHLASFEGDSKEILLKNIREIEDDKVRANIFQVVDILHDAFWYHMQRGTDINKSIWIGELTYVFNTHQRRAYVSAYEKFKSENRLSAEFVTFVDSLISMSQPQKNN